MKKIEKIVNIDALIMTCQFEDGEHRDIDFNKIASESKNKYVQMLKDTAVLATAYLADDGSFIMWPKLALIVNYDGSMQPCDLDIDAQALYKLSEQTIKQST
jgi:hypothetical protein